MTKTIAALQAEVAAASRIYYHGTASVYVDSIKAHGLIPRKAKGADTWARDHWKNTNGVSTEQRCVFLCRMRGQALSFSSLVASQFKGAEGALFRVSFPTGAHLVPDDKSVSKMDAVKFFGVIPPEWLKLVALAPVSSDVLKFYSMPAFLQNALGD